MEAVACQMGSCLQHSSLVEVEACPPKPWRRGEKQSGNWNTTAEYKYDARGRRILKVVTNKGGLNGTTRFLWGGPATAGWQCLEERDSSGDLVARYTYAPGYIDAVALQERDLNSDDDFGDANEVVYYHSNTLFTVYALSDGNESVIERYRYDAYGACTVLDADGSADADGLSDVEDPYTFTGRRLDVETGLMQYRSRYYHTGLGPFTGRDPAVYYDSYGLYAYVADRPTFSADPKGLIPTGSTRIGPYLFSVPTGPTAKDFEDVRAAAEVPEERKAEILEDLRKGQGTAWYGLSGYVTHDGSSSGHVGVGHARVRVALYDGREKGGEEPGYNHPLMNGHDLGTMARNSGADIVLNVRNYSTDSVLELLRAHGVNGKNNCIERLSIYDHGKLSGASSDFDWDDFDEEDAEWVQELGEGTFHTSSFCELFCEGWWHKADVWLYGCFVGSDRAYLQKEANGCDRVGTVYGCKGSVFKGQIPDFSHFFDPWNSIPDRPAFPICEGGYDHASHSGN